MRRREKGCACARRAFAAVWLCAAFAPLARADEIAEMAGDELAPRPASCSADPNLASPKPRPATAARSGERLTRSQLTGDWPARKTLAENGLTYFGDLTQYYQGVTAGGVSRRFAYGGRGDYLVDLDSGKLGLWQGGHLDLRGETRLGQDANAFDGALAPSNFAMALPLPGRNVTALTGVQYTQTISERLSVFAGKLDLLDGTPESYARGPRLNYFWNAAMQSNITRIYLLPSALGTGLTIRDEVEPVFNFYLLDSHFTPTTSGFSTLGANGVVMYGEYRLRTNWFDLPGHFVPGFLYSTANRTALDANPFILISNFAAGTPAPSKSPAWTATCRFDQVVYANSTNRSRNWTLNGDFGVSDGNPNPIHWFANVSLVASGLIRGRENDLFGIGYYHLGVSGLPVLEALGVGAENGFEAFYNAAVTPWFHVTPDLQVLDPARQRVATALLVGIRARLSF